jgi:hypothetical protein
VEATEQAEGRRLVEGNAKRGSGRNGVATDTVFNGILVSQDERIALDEPQIGWQGRGRCAPFHRFGRAGRDKQFDGISCAYRAV